MAEQPTSEGEGHAVETGGRYTREETIAHRADRNFAELLQELRVLETGVQILFAFLLGIAFQQRFAQTDAFQRWVYVGTLLATAVTIALVVAPVAIHRFTFHEGLKDELVLLTSRLAIAGLAALLVAIIGSMLLVLDWVTNRPFALATTAVFLAGFTVLWFIFPLRRRRRASPAGDFAEPTGGSGQ